MLTFPFDYIAALAVFALKFCAVSVNEIYECKQGWRSALFRVHHQK